MWRFVTIEASFFNLKKLMQCLHSNSQYTFSCVDMKLFKNLEINVQLKCLILLKCPKRRRPVCPKAHFMPHPLGPSLKGQTRIILSASRYVSSYPEQVKIQKWDHLSMIQREDD